MGYLSLTTFLWAFSFSLISVYLAAEVDPWFSVLSRITLAAFVFLPFLRIKEVRFSFAIKLMAIGASQLGIMYCFYYQSFLYLSVPEVLLFTVFTPIYVTLIYDLLHRQFSPWYLLTAALAVMGAIIIKYTSVNPNFLLGFLVVQGANLSFAIGQVAYKVVIERSEYQVPQHKIFALFYLGALCVALPAFLLLGNMQKLPTTSIQWGVLFYLGTIASGLGYFFWNKGATQVSAGSLAIMNNALIPIGILVNVLIWNRNDNWLTLSLGGAVILISLFLNETWVKNKVIASRA